MMASQRRTVRSTKSYISDGTVRMGGKDDPTKLENYLPGTCARFECPQDVIVIKNDITSSFRGKKKLSDKLASTPRTAEISSVDPDIIYVNAYYEDHNLVEVSIEQINIPRMFMKVLILIAPQYKHLKKMTLRRCRIDTYTIYEIHNKISLSAITELSFEGSAFVTGTRNYSLLLSTMNNLRNLSLQRCNITDSECEDIAKKLHFTCPAESTLVFLNLSSNEISNEGAKALGEALRSNRHLKYLNLADNRIDDDGLGYLLDSLSEFSLTLDEIANQRKRYTDYLQARHAAYAKYYDIYKHQDGLISQTTLTDKRKSRQSNTYSTSKKGSRNVNVPISVSASGTASDADYQLKLKVNLLIDKMIGEYDDPFGKKVVVNKNEHFYSIGNMVLGYLNLSYNHVTLYGVRKILNVLKYHEKINEPAQFLIIAIEGNFVQNNCLELAEIKEMFMSKTARTDRQYHTRSIDTLQLTKKGGVGNN